MPPIENEDPQETEDRFTSVDNSDAPSDESKAYLERREREMQADYTRKTQGIADLRRKAEQFDALLAQQQAGAMANQTKESLDAMEALEPTAVKGIEAVVQRIIRESLMPELNTYKGHIDGMVRENVQSRWNALQTEYPEAARYQGQMAEFLQRNPGISDLKQAFMAVAGQELVQNRAIADAAARRNVQLTRPNTSAASTEPVRKKKALWEYFQELDG